MTGEPKTPRDLMDILDEIKELLDEVRAALKEREQRNDDE